MVYFEGNRRGRPKELVLVGGLLLVALILFALPAAQQAPLREAVRSTALRPFLAAQSGLAEQRARRLDARELRAQRDSLAAVVAAQAPLAEENRRLRALLGLNARADEGFVAAEILHSGLPGRESTLLLNVGTAHGVQVGSAVLAAGGLLGVVWEADERYSVAIDWTHPDFRASAMTADGEAYGIVAPRRGRFREEDELVLSGAPFHMDIQPGTRIVTSGRGGVYRRGIPLGTVVGIEDADTGWRKSYLVRPAVRPQAVSQALVAVIGDLEQRGDLSPLFPAGPADPAAEPES